MAKPTPIVRIPTSIADFKQLIEEINARLIEQLPRSLRRFIPNPADKEVDLNYHRTLNMGDPKDDLDGVNLRTLKRFVASISRQDEAQSTGDVLDQHYAWFFTKDGVVATLEESPSTTVHHFREGFPYAVAVTAETAPAIVSLKVNWKVTYPGDVTEYDLLDPSLPLELPIGEKGPVFSEELAKRDLLVKGTKARMIIVQGGTAEQVVGSIAVRRTR